MLEVKQDLNREHVLYSGKKAASVRRLHRTSAPIPHAGGAYDPRPLPRIVSGLVTYQSAWNPPFGDAFADALSELGLGEQLDIGCALLHGAFEATYHTGQPVDLTIAPGQRSLLQFLFRLLKQLQALATAPAIDYGAYLARFDRAEGST